MSSAFSCITWSWCSCPCEGLVDSVVCASIGYGAPNVVSVVIGNMTPLLGDCVVTEGVICDVVVCLVRKTESV